MKLTIAFSIAATTVLGLARLAAAATVPGFSGKWPITVTYSMRIPR
jgi:hypothetical protein